MCFQSGTDHHPFHNPKQQHLLLASTLFGFALLLPFGITTGKLLPTVGLVPLGLSGLRALITLRVHLLNHARLFHRERRGDYQIVLGSNDKEPNARKKVLSAIGDFVIAVGLLVVIALSLVDMTNSEMIWIPARPNTARGYWWNVETAPTVLGTYGTVPLWVSFFVHFHLFLKACGKGIKGQFERMVRCPECYAHARQQQDEHLSMPEGAADADQGGSKKPIGPKAVVQQT